MICPQDWRRGCITKNGFSRVSREDREHPSLGCPQELRRGSVAEWGHRLMLSLLLNKRWHGRETGPVAGIRPLKE
jgi:hypothetical protein